MAGHYINTVENEVTGKPVNGATVLVYVDGATIAADGDSVTSGTLATIYSDDGVTPIVQASSPLTTGSDGEFDFYTSETRVVIEISYDGEARTVWNDVDILGGTVSSDVTALATRMSAAEVITLDATVVAFKGLTGAADKVPYFTGVDTMALADFTAAGRALVDDASASAQRTTLGLGTIAVLDETTTAQYRANTADKALSTDQVWASAAYVALTDAATIAVDFSAGFNFSVTLGDNRTLGAPSNTKDGQTGAIVITQDGTGSRTLAYHANWKFAGGTDPTLSTAAGAVDILFYQVISSTSIVANLVKAIA